MRFLIWITLLVGAMLSGHALAGDSLQQTHGGISPVMPAAETDAAMTRGQEFVLESSFNIEDRRGPETPEQFILDRTAPFRTQWNDPISSSLDDYNFDLARAARSRMERQHDQFRRAPMVRYDSPPAYQSQPPDYYPLIFFWYPFFMFNSQDLN